MVNKLLSKKLAQINNEGEYEREYYEYFLNILSFQIIELVLIMTASWLLGIFWYTLVAVCVFMYLRSNIKGYHSKSKILCTVISVVVLCLLGLIGKYIDITIELTSIVGVVYISKYYRDWRLKNGKL